MMSVPTPTVDQVRSPSVMSISTRTMERVPRSESRMRTLKSVSSKRLISG